MVKTIISLIFPTFNERDNILKVIPVAKKALLEAGFDYEIIVVDDNSPDLTAESITDQFRQDPKIRVIKRIKNRGYATAIRTGIEASKGKIVGSFDADYLGPATPLIQMLKIMTGDKKVKFTVASRYVGGTRGMELRFRNLASHFFNLFMNVLGYPLTDNTSGFYLISRSDLFQMPFDQIFFGYGDCFFRLAYLAKKNNLKMVEVPVYYSKRIYGQSKTRLATVFFQYSFAAIKFRLSL